MMNLNEMKSVFKRKVHFPKAFSQRERERERRNQCLKMFESVPRTIKGF